MSVLQQSFEKAIIVVSLGYSKATELLRVNNVMHAYDAATLIDSSTVVLMLAYLLITTLFTDSKAWTYLFRWNLFNDYEVGKREPSLYDCSIISNRNSIPHHHQDTYTCYVTPLVRAFHFKSMSDDLLLLLPEARICSLGFKPFIIVWKT